MNTPIEHPQPRQPRSYFNDPPSRPSNVPAYSFGNGNGDGPPRARPAVEEFTGALRAVAPALNRLIEEQQVAHGGSQELARATLEELRRQPAEFGKVHLSLTALAAAVAETRHEIADLRRDSDSMAGALNQLATDVQLVRETQEKWTEEFVARHATDPFLAGYAVLLGNLWEQARVADPALRPCLEMFADDVVRFLDTMNIELIRPAQGDRLDPHRHQPLSAVATEDSEKHGRVAATYQPGLCCGPRIIQRARVAVFTHKPSTQTQTQCSERNTP